MSLKLKMATALVAAAFATSALAEGTIQIDDAYARSSGQHAKAGAAFMMIVNNGDTDDRLIGVDSDAAARIELHTHEVDANGVAKMVHLEEGLVIPAGETHMLARGGDHVMFMGLTQPFENGATVPVTLIFEKAGPVELEIPVDLDRKDSGHSH